MNKVFNYSSGPSSLPKEVLTKIQCDLQNYNGTSLSVLEIDHRTTQFRELSLELCDNLRRLIDIPHTYKIALLQGGATTLFSSIPLNFSKNGKADYVISGYYSDQAFREAQKHTHALCVASSKEQGFTSVPHLQPSMLRKDADYVHICQNNTVYGTRFDCVPKCGNVPLIADMSSYLLSEKMDITRYAAVYASAQKNIGAAGLTIFIVKNDLPIKQKNDCPLMLDLQAQLDQPQNTPPIFSIYVSTLVTRWLIKQGGLNTIQKLNEQKARLLYDFIDDSDFYSGTAMRAYRSLVNIAFATPSKDLDLAFINTAAKHGLINLQLHPKAGICASLYNASSIESALALIAFMQKFHQENK